MDKFKDINQYKQYLQSKTEELFGNREKVSKREFFSVFHEQISQLNSQGLNRLNNIFEMDGDETTVSKKEMMTAYSLMDLEISNKTPDGELNAQNSILNTANDKEFNQFRDSVANAYKEVIEPEPKDNNQDITPRDSSRVKQKFGEVPKFNPNDYTLEALKERFPEPEYNVYEQESYIIGLSPTIYIEKDGKKKAVISNDDGDIIVSLYEYDEHENRTKNTHILNGNVISIDENKYIYDGNGNVISELRYENGKLKGGSYKEYDEHNNVTFDAILDENKRPITTSERTYDSFESYYVKDKNGELIEVYSICDSQEEVDYFRSQGDRAYLRSEVDSVKYYSIETSNTVRDANGNVIEEYRMSRRDEDGNKLEGVDSHSPLADEIYAAICAKNSQELPTTDLEGLKKAIDKLHPSNIGVVLSYFYRLAGQDILSAIKGEWGARITNKKEMDEIIDKIKTMIINSDDYLIIEDYLYKALSGIPDTKFAEDLIMAKNFNPVTADSSFQKQSGKSLIQTIMDKYLTMSLKTREKLIRHIIDETIGTPEDYGGTVYFDIEGVKKEAYDELDRQLNKFGTMDATKLDEILQNAPLNINYNAPNIPNGKIDKIFSQAFSGDCWLISAIMAIALTKNADKYFSDILKINDSGSIEVKLKSDILNITDSGNIEVIKNGTDKIYTITKRNIILGGFLKGTKGDGDVKAIELAFEQLLIESGRSKDNALDGGTIYDAFLALVGADKLNFHSIKGLSADFIKNKFNADNAATIVSRYDKLKHSVNTAYKADGTEVRLVTNHGWAISRTDDKYVYFIDPNVGTEELHIAIEDFKMAFDLCAVATLD